MQNHRFFIAAVALAAGMMATSSAYAQSAGGQNTIAVGYAWLSLNDGSSELAGPNTPPGVEVRVDDPGAFTATYVHTFGERFGAEVKAGLPFDIEVNAAGTLDGLGKVVDAKVASVSLLGNYYFTPSASQVRPYIGAGVNYTTYYDAEATPTLNATLSGDTDVSIEDSSGLTFYAGIDYALNDNWLVAANIGYIQAETEADLATDTVVDLGAGPMNVGIVDREIDIELNPVVYGLSFGYRF